MASATVDFSRFIDDYKAVDIPWTAALMGPVQRYDADDPRWTKINVEASPLMRSGDVLVVGDNNWQLITNIGGDNMAPITDRESIRLQVNVEFVVRLPVDAPYSGTVTEEERVIHERNYIRSQVDWLYNRVANAINEVTQASRTVLEEYGADITPASIQDDGGEVGAGEYDYDVRISRQ